MDIYFYEAFEEEERQIRAYIPEHIKAGFTWKTIQETGHTAPLAKIISTRTQSVIPESWAEKTTAILSRSTGYDHLIDYRQKAKQCPDLGYLPLYCYRAVAEQAMMLWMMLLRKMPLQISNFHNFHRDGLTGREAEHKTLLVVGVGNIGSEICRIGLGMNMKVLGVDIDVKHPEFDHVSIEEGICQADIIVSAMNLNKTNFGYFNTVLLKKAKKDAVFVNISRGEISPSTELLKVYKSSHLAGIALDVYDHEKELANALRNKIKSNDPEVMATLELAQMPNVILTPHNAFNSAEGVDRKARQSVEQMLNFLDKGKFIWEVPQS